MGCLGLIGVGLDGGTGELGYRLGGIQVVDLELVGENGRVGGVWRDEGEVVDAGALEYLDVLVVKLGVLDPDVLGDGVHQCMGELQGSVDPRFIAVEVHVPEGFGSGECELLTVIGRVLSEFFTGVEVGCDGVVDGLQLVGETVGEVGLVPVVGLIVRGEIGLPTVVHDLVGVVLPVGI